MILTEEQARVLEYVYEANQGGARPTSKQIKEWRKNPQRHPAQRGKLIRAEVKGQSARRVYDHSALFGVQNSVTQSFIESAGLQHARMMKDVLGSYSKIWGSAAAISASRGWVGNGMVNPLGLPYRTIPAVPGKPAVYEPDTPREGFLDHLRRLEWLSRDETKGYEITALGRALLRRYHVQEIDPADDVLFLGAEARNVDYSRLIGRIAEMGDAMILDAYLGPEQVRDLLEYTSVTRFLVTNSTDKRQASRVSAAGVQLRTWKTENSDEVREMRQAKLHDRLIISSDAVHILGASLNGVGKANPTVLYRMPDHASQALRDYAEKLWDEAAVALPRNRPGVTI